MGASQLSTDIAFTVQHLSQFSSGPSHEHWTAVKHVLRYLKGHAALSITYGGTSDLTLTGPSSTGGPGLVHICQRRHNLELELEEATHPQRRK
ncbi:hypothetical protein NM688_g3596 [Phlebia brevispora]|uniref:Uncharacterized protein n=1 Tax=Phlebia brevispora TaxID=194682 RepID=A0ACC1T5Q0_9APHY|nr:hypothetical protein NM688_g3596 [Phlebia brevispora]